MNIIFNKLYIFDIAEKKAFTIKFLKGINIITSDLTNGTDRGKSVLLRSLYHTLGADALFEKKWKNTDKVYILTFKINNEKYTIYRAIDLFKIFNKDDNLVFTTNSRTELAIFLEKLWEFGIYLPDRNNKKLTIAPPAYSYLLYFLDQDKYDGSTFTSFDNLGQFSNFKQNVIYSHLGVFNKKYFNLVVEKETIEDNLKDYNNQNSNNETMKKEIKSLLEDITCPENIESLENELKLKSKEYSVILNEINEERLKLTELENQKQELIISISQINKFKEANENQIETILKKNICPECHQILNDSVTIRSKKYNYTEDSIMLTNKMQNDIESTQKEIEKRKIKYQDLLEKLNQYNKSLQINKKELNDYSKFKGLNELYDKLNNDIVTTEDKILDLENQLKAKKDLINESQKQKKSINDEYYSLLIKAKTNFNLSELTEDNIKNLSKSFTASGSNKPIVTVIWYLTLHELIRKFNTNAVTFPMVFDSPTNAEMDKEKKQHLIQHIIDSAKNFNQLIFSSIGFEETDFNLSSKPNIINLTNNKYNLLNTDCYNLNSAILEKYTNKVDYQK